MSGVALASSSESGSERIRGVDARAERGGLPQLALDDPSSLGARLLAARWTVRRRRSGGGARHGYRRGRSHRRPARTNLPGRTARSGRALPAFSPRPRPPDLAPWVDELVPGSAHQAMLAVGVVEILAGVLVTARPAIGGYAGAAWLLGIIVIPRGSLTTRHRPARLLSPVRRSGPARSPHSATRETSPGTWHSWASGSWAGSPTMAAEGPGTRQRSTTVVRTRPGYDYDYAQSLADDHS